eukprot:396260-Rhodomonas_salina.1
MHAPAPAPHTRPRVTLTAPSREPPPASRRARRAARAGGGCLTLIFLVRMFSRSWGPHALGQSCWETRRQGAEGGTGKLGMTSRTVSSMLSLSGRERTRYSMARCWSSASMVWVWWLSSATTRSFTLSGCTLTSLMNAVSSSCFVSFCHTPTPSISVSEPDTRSRGAAAAAGASRSCPPADSSRWERPLHERHT